jgi:hypothetical protein
LKGFGSFPLKLVFTDSAGRFHLQDMTPENGNYSVQLEPPGVVAESAKLDFDSQPQTIRLKRGRTLAGRVVEAGTGCVIPYADVEALEQDRAVIPVIMTRTDSDGRFAFTTLNDAIYELDVLDNRHGISANKYRADDSTNLVLAVKLAEGSQLKPGASR